MSFSLLPLSKSIFPLRRIFLLFCILLTFSFHAHSKETAKPIQAIDFSQVPVIRFLAPDKAEMTWQFKHDTECKTVLEEGKRTFSTKGKKHRIVLDKLGHQKSYTIKLYKKNKIFELISEPIILENSVNYSRMPISKSNLSDKAKAILQIHIKKGFIALLGKDSDKLAKELAGSSDLTISLISFKAEEALKWRHSLYKAGLYGSRATVYHSVKINELPITAKTFNFIFSESAPQKELYQWIKPHGFILSSKSIPAHADFLKSKRNGSLYMAQRSQTKGSGEWTAQYGNGGNTSYSGEELNGLSQTADLKLQWIGRPGGDFGIDRNPRMPAPLAAKGRLFHQGMNRMVAIDAHNGTILWSLEIPHLRRVNIPRDASNWTTDGDFLYTVVKNQLLIIDCRDGAIANVIQVPDNTTNEWGYIGQEADRIYGSSILKNSQYSKFWTKSSWYDKIKIENTAKVCSLSFFAKNKKTGKQLWSYQKGIIINTTICFRNNLVYFVECRQKDLLKSTSLRISDARIWKDQFLVCLDGKTGKKIFEKTIDTTDGDIVFYLQVDSQGIFLTASNSKTKMYHLDAFSLKGKPLWSNSNKWQSNHHSGHIQHPVIVDDTIYLQPYAYSISTGKTLFKGIGKREGCHTYVGFKQGLLFRGTNRQISMWSKANKETTTWKRLRPSCWLSMLPANGMILVPEGGGGCSCGGWIETSLGFAPAGDLK